MAYQSMYSVYDRSINIINRYMSNSEQVDEKNTLEKLVEVNKDGGTHLTSFLEVLSMRLYYRTPDKKKRYLYLQRLFNLMYKYVSNSEVVLDVRDYHGLARLTRSIETIEHINLWYDIMNKMLKHIYTSSRAVGLKNMIYNNCRLVVSFMYTTVDAGNKDLHHLQFVYLCNNSNIKSPFNNCEYSSPLLATMSSSTMISKMFLEELLYRGADHGAQTMKMFEADGRTVCSPHIYEAVKKYASDRAAHRSRFAECLAWIGCNPVFGSVYLDGLDEFFK